MPSTHINYVPALPHTAASHGTPQTEP
jgi:hypothetical protein